LFPAVQFVFLPLWNGHGAIGFGNAIPDIFNELHPFKNGQFFSFFSSSSSKAAIFLPQFPEAYASDSEQRVLAFKHRGVDGSANTNAVLLNNL
jgi:hypothetical protein